MPTFVEAQKATGIGMPLYSINQSDDKIETNINADFIIHGFELSWNGQVITEDVCAENMNTLIGQPVLVKYYNEGEKDKDHLGTHEVYTVKNRDTGEDMMATDTIAIGTFQSVEIKDMDVNGENKRCLVGHAQLWMDRYYNICSLLNEWLQEGINISCSCEYVFKNYEMRDDIQYVKSPYSYTGHTILNSEKKDGYDIVLPAYDEARMVSWNTAIEKDRETISGKCEVEKVENVFITALNEISIGETRSKIYEALAKVMTAEEYMNMWMSDWDVFDNYFVYETYMDNEWKHFKVGYTKAEDELTVDFENRTEVKFETVMVEASKAEEKEAELNGKVQEVTEQAEALEAELNTVKEDALAQKESVIALNETIESLNETITALNSYKEAYEADKYEKALSEAMELYKGKFAKLNAMDKFESEEVQTMIAETLDEEKALNAKTALADMLVDLIVVEAPQASVNTKGGIVEPAGATPSLNAKIVKKVIRDVDTYVTNE